MSLTAVILAAGQGTRMKSRSPKVLHPVLGEAMVRWVVRAAQAAGAQRCVVVVGVGAEAVRAELADLAHVDFATQVEQRGTGDALKAALPVLDPSRDERLLVLCGDVPLIDPEELKQLAGSLAERPAAVLTFEAPEPGGYGRMLRNAEGLVSGIVEAKDASPEQLAITEVNSGTYAFETRFVLDNLDRLTTQNAQGEFYLTDLIAFSEGAVGLCTPHPERLEGANDRAGLAALNASARDLVNGQHMANGVGMEDPHRIWIGPRVCIGSDSFLESDTRLMGETVLGEQVHVHQGCQLRDSTVGDGSVLHPYSVLEEAKVGAGCSVGPYGRLRPAAELQDGAKIGNFVEVKKAVLGPGAKANHLAYIGDASVGAGANVGAGTITCNYDGANKHKTEIGEGSFIGSNSTLVAPVEIQDQAYVAAGSVITMEVPEDALGVGRTRQRNIKGWVSRKAPKKDK